jgi:hypothetical protein
MPNSKLFALLATILLIAASSAGQSLGDVARQQKQQKQQTKTSTAQHKVITDDDLPAHTDDSDSSPSDNTARDKTGDPSPSSSTKKTADEWKSQIQAQKAKVAALQTDVEKLNASVRYVTANAYSNGVQYNQAQLHKQQEAERLQKQLDQEKKALADMQEACRKAGFGSSVYD